MNNKIFILGYPFGDYVECYPGIITSISDNDFEHNCNTDEGSSDTPIILISNSNVIGIHKGGILERNSF